MKECIGYLQGVHDAREIVYTQEEKFPKLSILAISLTSFNNILPVPEKKIFQYAPEKPPIGIFFHLYCVCKHPIIKM
jgi:hypothetical protein